MIKRVDIKKDYQNYSQFDDEDDLHLYGSDDEQAQTFYVDDFQNADDEY